MTEEELQKKAEEWAVIEDENVTYVPVEVEMWCNKPTKELDK